MLIQNPREPQAPRYDLTTIWLHWATVGLIAALWVIGQTADWVPRGPFRTGLWSIHVILGLATGLVLLTRVAWRAHFGLALPPADTGILHAIAGATHYLLYILLGAVVVLGIIDASYRGFDLFGIWSVPQFGTGNAATRRDINEWHELAANLTVLVAFLHALAALVHQYVWRDRLLDRMSL
ncbi:cytochrome b [Bradyrhizobium sp. CCBAU 53338]|uniref:cytochrome b n=1 Tax=Bradyrhizobium sp. CCBAU 53338 TaxID=1325111 RepID=UPI00188CE68C|nr:cytochrome b [Bradyrhizobium sp. CCBAU 53338]QOZ51636.1 cytochrome b [Bradyrhizobium sp. CCBAU 53338]